MQAIQLQTEVQVDGKLHLQVPCQYPPGPVEVLLVVHPLETNGRKPGHGGKPHQARSGLFVGKAREAVNLDESLAEMNETWKAKLADLQP